MRPQRQHPAKNTYLDMPTRDADLVTSSSRKSATLTRLLKEARQAFADKGLSGARVDDIARAAGVTKQLVYHYFSSKEGLFASVLDESVHQVLADFLALDLDQLAPPEALRALLEHFFDLYQTDPTLKSLTQESLRLHEQQEGHRNRFTGLAPILVGLMEQILQRGAVTGEFIPGVDARLFCAASGLLTTGGVTSRYIVSTLAGFDTTTPEGSAAWRQYSVDFVLATVLTRNHPARQSLSMDPTTLRHARPPAA